MTTVSTAPRNRRLNVRTALLVAVLVLVVVPGLLVLKSYGDRKGQGMLLAEARRRIERKQPHLALGYLSRYLELNPDDLDALDLKAELLAEGVQSEAQALDAIAVHNQVLSRDPGRQKTRRRLIELTLAVRGQARAAEALARGLIQRDAGDAKAHRLLAHALERIAADGDARALAEAVRAHQRALQIEPGDIEGAERLAFLAAERFNDPGKALQVLDQLVQAEQESPRKLAEARLVRCRYFLARNQPDWAAAEIDQAILADPANIAVRLAAAEVAIRRGEVETARQHLDKVSRSARTDLQVTLIEGLIELEAERPEDAIPTWRAGLFLTDGPDIDLTWRLAHILLELGRTREAEPLLSQYRRLKGGDEPGPRFHYLRGFGLLKMNRFAEAIATLEGIRFQIDGSLVPSLYYLLGQCHESARDLAKAFEAYRQSADASPHWNAPWLAIARLQLSDYPAEAITTLQRGLALVPRDAAMLAALARLHWRQQVQLPHERRSWTEFELVMAQARTRIPSSVDPALVQADYLMVTGKADDALALLQVATRLRPKSVLLWRARANALSRMRQPASALAALDQAAAACGDNAELLVTRASIMTGQGHTAAARILLRAGLERVPSDQQPLLLKAEGELAAGQDDQAGTRRAYTAWARLRSDDPEPRIGLVDLAIAARDETARRAAVDALEEVGGPYWRLARVAELLCARPDAPLGSPRLDEAARLIHAIETNNPALPLGYLLEGRLMEQRNEIGKAITAYENALDMRAGPAASRPLVALLSRQEHTAAFDRVRAKLASIAPGIEPLAPTEAVRAGNTSRALELTARMAQGDPQALDARVWQAQVLGPLGKPSEAEAALRRLIAQRPDEPAPWIQLLMFLVGQKRMKDAAAVVEQIHTQVKTDRPGLLEAQCYQVAGDPRRSYECYQAALARWPDDLAVRVAAIQFAEETDRRAEAEALLRDLLKHDPELGWATRKLATALAGHAADPAAWAEALVLIGPSARPDDLPDDVLARAIVYARSPGPRHRRQAVEILERLLAGQPGLAAAHLLLAQLLLASGETARAQVHTAEAATGGDATAEAIQLHADILVRRGALEEAQRQLERLVAVDPGSLPVAELRARILAARGRGSEAAVGLEGAFADRINTPEGLAIGAKMIRLLLDLNQPHAAERVARQLAGLGPRGNCVLAEFLATHAQAEEALALLRAVAGAGGNHDAASSCLAIAQAPGLAPGARGRWLDLADTFLAAALKEQPDALDLLQKQAFLRHLQHRPEHELQLYDTMLSLHPKNYMFLNNMAWTLSEDLHRPEEGLKQANEALARLGWQPHLLDTRGVIETRLGRLDDAIKDLEEAASALPTASVYFHLARAFQKKGRMAEFRASRDRARQAGICPEQLEESEKADWNLIMCD
jgi:tetratricopeptide (TPR) repeat protein